MFSSDRVAKIITGEGGDIPTWSRLFIC